MEFFQSFKCFKSRKKFTGSLFSGHALFPRTIFDYIGTTFDQHFFDYNNILISMKKDEEHIAVNTARATFLLHK